MKNQIILKTTNTKITCQKLTHQKSSKMFQTYADIWDCLITLDHTFYKKQEVRLAELFAALFTQFGQSNGYDDYKCSFSYAFRLTIEKDGMEKELLLNIYDYKGGMPSYKFYGNEPKEEVLMQQELKYVAMELLTFLINTFREQHADFNQNFYRANQAGFLIYGFEDGDFFHHQHDNYTEYGHELFRDAIRKMKKRGKFETVMSQ